MAFTAYGYQKIRDAIKNTLITHIELRNSSDGAIGARIPVGDSRVVASQSGTFDQYIITLKPTDAGIGLSNPIAKYAFYDVLTAGTALDVDTLKDINSSPYIIAFTSNDEVAKITLKINTPL